MATLVIARSWTFYHKSFEVLLSSDYWNKTKRFALPIQTFVLCLHKLIILARWTCQFGIIVNWTHLRSQLHSCHGRIDVNQYKRSWQDATNLDQSAQIQMRYMVKCKRKVFVSETPNRCCLIFQAFCWQNNRGPPWGNTIVTLRAIRTPWLNT